jgi:F-type H+-transporting ATPase subunit delta
MNENSLAKRYARALLKTTADEPTYLGNREALATVCNLLDTDATFKTAMVTSICSQAQKRELLDTLHAALQFADTMRRFLGEILAENRMAVLHHIAAQYDALWNESQHIEKVRVFSAVALDAGRLAALRASLEKAFTVKVELESTIDASLLAGLRIERGSRVYDFSLAANLDTLRATIAGD